MHTIISLALLFTMAVTPVYAQFYELGGGMGVSTYLGDLSPSDKMTSHGEVLPAFSAFLRKGFVEGLSIKLTFSNLQVGAADKRSKDFSRRQRNLSFRSSITEFSLAVEFYPFSGLYSSFFSMTQLVLHAGVALFLHNPRTRYGGNWHFLQPLSTEGQGTSGSLATKPYPLGQCAVPFGAGMVVFFKHNLSAGFGMNLRKTFTDYLDDVSGRFASPTILAAEVGELAAILSNRNPELGSASTTAFLPGDIRGNPERKDWYLSLEISLGILVHSRGRGGRWWGNRRKSVFF